jgi:hypothetical protein
MPAEKTEGILRTVNVHEAKTTLSALLAEVHQGLRNRRQISRRNARTAGPFIPTGSKPLFRSILRFAFTPPSWQLFQHDPCDRMIIPTARIHQLPAVIADSVFKLYDAPILGCQDESRSESPNL